MTSNELIPWINSAGEGGERYSMQALQGDGTTGPWEFNFAGGYIDVAHIRAYRYDPATATATPQTLALVGPNQVKTSDVIPADQIVVLYRDTPKKAPLVDYSEGAVMDEKHLDMTAQQAVFAAAETIDRFGTINVAVSEAIARAETAEASASTARDEAVAAAATASAAANQAQARWDDIHGKFTVSTAPPSGGKDGDIWFQVTPN